MELKITSKNITIALLFATIIFQAYIIRVNDQELTEQQVLMEKMIDMIADDTASFHDNLIGWQ